MSKDVKLSNDLSVAYLPTSKAIIHTNLSAVFSENQKASKGISVSQLATPEKSGNVAYWGSNNLFPQDVIRDAEQDPFIRPLLSRKINAHYGRGIEVGIKEYDDNGKEKFITGGKDFESILKPVKAFMQYGGGLKYLRNSISDFNWFYNAFPELILSNDKKSISKISELRAAECRYMVKEKTDVVPKKLFLNANWDNGGSEENSVKIDILDPDDYPIETLLDKQYSKFIYPISYPDPSRHYYPLAPWNVYRSSKWSEFVQKIPEFKLAIMKNSILLRWHVVIHASYYEWRFKEDWRKTETDQNERKKLLDIVFTEINEMIAGTENAGKALFTHNTSTTAGEELELIKITRLDEKLDFGNINTDSAEASSFAIFQFEIHPTLVGHAPGAAKNSMGAGSGSDQRVAWNNYLSTIGMQMDILFAPLYFIRDFNKWDERIEFRFIHEIQTTQDVSKEPQQIAK